MISDITLGQYFPGYSKIHRLDPRTKILLAIAFIVSVFLANNLVGFILLTLVCLVLMWQSRISFRVMLKGIKPIIIILIFTAIINVFLTTGNSEPLVDWWIFTI